VVHDAIAESDEASLHITLGLYPQVMKDVLQEIIQAAAENDVDFRRSALLPNADRTSLLQQAKEMFENALSEDNVTTALSRLKDKTASKLKPDQRIALIRHLLYANVIELS